ncbi:MAG TPA: hypothetical protein VHF22_09900 [Planctomycetota bacterium]|nr:hypothetical protein [Planctomycetota bacterium]
MPLIKDEKGEPINAECINKCGALEELDEPIAMVVVGEKDPQRVTVLICPDCQYMELYYGA